MNIQTHFSLKKHNTFGIDVHCENFVELDNQDDASNFIQHKLDKSSAYLIIGEGSNLLFTQDFKGSIIQMQNKGFEVIDENNSYVWIKAAAGEKWDDLLESYKIQRTTQVFVGSFPSQKSLLEFINDELLKGNSGKFSGIISPSKKTLGISISISEEGILFLCMVGEK